MYFSQKLMFEKVRDAVTTFIQFVCLYVYIYPNFLIKLCLAGSLEKEGFQV